MSRLFRLSVVAAIVVLAAFMFWNRQDHVREDPILPPPNQTHEQLPAPTTTGPRSVASGAPPSQIETTSAAPPKPDLLAITVIDELARPIQGSGIWSVIETGRPVALGNTSAEGKLSVPRDSAIAEYCASARGFATRTVLNPSAEQAEIKIRLSREGRLSGRVEGAVLEGVDVFTWEFSHMTAPIDLANDCYHGDPRVAWATTDPRGHFEILGLDPETDYRVAAISRGSFGEYDDHEEGIRPTRDDLVIKMSSSFGVVIRLLDDRGQPISVPDEYTTNTAFVVAPGFRNPPAHFIQPSLLQSATHPEVGPTGGAYHPITVACETELPTIGPFLISINYPGYEPAQTEVYAYSLRDPLVERTVVMKETAQGRGTIIITKKLNQVGGSEEYERLEFGGLRLNLLSEDRPQQSYKLSLSGQECTISGIPYGTYSWMVSSSVVPLRIPASQEVKPEVRVGALPARIEVDFSGLGELSLKLLRKDGSEYVGPARILLLAIGKGYSGQTGLLSFGSSPYVVRAAPATRYIVRLKAPVAFCTTDESCQIDIVSGRRAEIQFTLK